MESLRKRMMDYLQKGQCLSYELSNEIANNLIDVTDAWITDVRETIDEETSRDDVLFFLREEIGTYAKKT